MFDFARLPFELQNRILSYVGERVPSAFQHLRLPWRDPVHRVEECLIGKDRDGGRFCVKTLWKAAMEFISNCYTHHLDDLCDQLKELQQIWPQDVSQSSFLEPFELLMSRVNKIWPVTVREFYSRSDRTDLEVMITNLCQCTSDMKYVTVCVGGVQMLPQSECSGLSRVVFAGSGTILEEMAHVSNLQTVVIEADTAISSCSFNWNVSLTTLIINGHCTIGWRAFVGCTALKYIAFNSGLTKLGIEAFADCTSLLHLTIPGSVKVIPAKCFSLCASLRTVHIEAGTLTIAEAAFEFCSRLRKVQIPDTVTAIEARAFKWCVSLTELAIPHGVLTLGDELCVRCSKLQRVVLPKSILSIGLLAFSDCERLRVPSDLYQSVQNACGSLIIQQ
jgi:hypothetical protein